ncbi:1307_t:CDS:2 [Funneliformis mosseae]|uniref:1307_t:CDS:1 n=1 Tax=Funneliformis mosseae TaxID=27381 RepID=A0A9N9C9P2_FUNMO|nr:1307_t:CDS:2 [Funneliformis mosseae]
MYTGELDLSKQLGENIFELLIASDELLLEELFKHVQGYLIEKHTTIPNNIYEEIEEFHYKKVLPKTITLPSRIGTPASAIIDPSAIIKPKLATIIANWIDRNDSAVLSFNNNYKFNLIYLKSRDGLDCNTFNNQCNGQGPFILLIRVQSKKIYGGFNPIGYNLREGQWLLTSDSFIFSFENNQDTRNMKIGRVINKYYSVYEDYFQFFFNFGNHLQAYKGNGQNFFYLGNHRIYSNIFNRTCTRDYPIEEIEEMEVFSVVRK